MPFHFKAHTVGYLDSAGSLPSSSASYTACNSRGKLNLRPRFSREFSMSKQRKTVASTYLY
ncbi:hypothetical protein, partial [Pseudomonas sp. FSL R10-0765]|uniref:hypothetical protein n=1 Tax=Pseudomonas sp. FSL R10-0765 TaxID=2662195 RepID=UPI001C499340